MTADYTVSCDSAEYRFGFIWACVMILVYPIGCPAYYFYLLYNVRHQIQMGYGDDTMSEKVGESLESLETVSEEMRAKQQKLVSLKFLYDSYQPHYWWWEIAETTQRVLLTGILVLIAQGSAIQIVVGALLTLSFLRMYARYEPYRDSFVLSIKIISYWQIFFVFWIALLIKADFPSMSDRSLGLCLVFVIFANIFNDLWKAFSVFVSSFFYHRVLSTDSLISFYSCRPTLESETEMKRVMSTVTSLSFISPIHEDGESLPGTTTLHEGESDHGEVEGHGGGGV
jgi:hypothetical protein